ncbi:type II toxin-antitoxin system RelE/ParE family toxin [Enterobacteriaceae bacterium H18W14]|uniref:type II toxin-antitoxin system RelE/ParE family toxin n=1 Tax=Dryocola boscaweniae TaxID=2925397 RepID=UPI0022F0536C|nr:type II toxin-antitoxin system RelE/ParE family toxin [Dryocola boscaweniae]MCT4713483.1 type II toxin-antitoxin system RelE/ParE family toxin [Dryocola boscaweniae]
MTLTIQWEAQVRSDREAISRFLYQEAGLPVASATGDRFVHVVGILKENPPAGTKAGKTDKQRKLVVPRFPFIIVYVTEDMTVRILRILHTSRKLTGRYLRS